jgi:hypothetical protein
MKDENIIEYLRKALRKEPEFKGAIAQIETRVIAATYLNIFGEDHEARVTAKQIGWTGLQLDIKSLWSITRGLIPSYVNLEGNAEV